MLAIKEVGTCILATLIVWVVTARGMGAIVIASRTRTGSAGLLLASWRIASLRSATRLRTDHASCELLECVAAVSALANCCPQARARSSSPGHSRLSFVTRKLSGLASILAP